MFRYFNASTITATIAAIAMVLASALGPESADAEYEFVGNGGFDSNVSGWVNQGGGHTMLWEASADRLGDPSSGGARMAISVEGTIATGMTQCIDIVPGLQYSASADARVPITGNSPGSHIYVYPVYFTNDFCGGNTAGSVVSNTTGTSLDTWQHLVSTATAPANAESIWLYVVLNKGTAGIAAHGFVDNVSLQALGNVDGDACSDGEEQGPDPAFGGDRDPTDAWDFFDVTSDKAIDLSDATAILGKFGLQDGNQGYDAQFDRYAPDAQKPYRTAQADSEHAGIDLGDALVSLQSFGHSCAG